MRYPWNTMDRIIGLLDKSASGCWEWTRSITKLGYGQVKWGDQVKLVHRLVYEHLRGQIPDGMALHHTCSNRKCANPDHLEPMTLRENSLLGMQKRWG